MGNKFNLAWYDIITEDHPLRRQITNLKLFADTQEHQYSWNTVSDKIKMKH